LRLFVLAYIVAYLDGLQAKVDALLPAGLRQWRSAEGRGLGIGERRAQNFSMSTTAKFAKINQLII